MIFTTAAFAALALFGPITTTQAYAIDKRQDASGYHWVNTWTSMPQLVEPNNMPPAPFVRLSPSNQKVVQKGTNGLLLILSQSSGAVLKNATLRQTLHISLGTSRLKLAISNTFGGSDLPISAGSIGLPANGAAGVSGIQSSPLAPITVGGKTSFTVPRGQVVMSDEIAFDVKPQSMVTVSLYSEKGQSGSSITGHPGSRTTSWFASGNRVNETALTGATASVHWYFVSAVQAYVPKEAGALVVLGDSITDGRGSEDNKNNRWVWALSPVRRGSNGLTYLQMARPPSGSLAKY
jgi:hypothetical protein